MQVEGERKEEAMKRGGKRKGRRGLFNITVVLACFWGEGRGAATESQHTRHEGKRGADDDGGDGIGGY